jgi:hypothetical protein
MPRMQYVYPDSYRGYGNRPAPTCPDLSRGRRRSSSGVLRLLVGIGLPRQWEVQNAIDGAVLLYFIR